jgi:ABC-2 type transport system ATP-binding protein
MPDAIVVEHLVKRYKSSPKPAVDDISFTVGEGEFFAFLGPNGAGKTTTISILTTTLEKSSGVVKIAGHDLDESASAVRKSIGVIFQNQSLDDGLTAEENLRIHAALYNIYPFRPLYVLMPHAYKHRVHELAEVIGLGDKLFERVGTFSGGMRRKLEIIRSLLHRPHVLFLDEPSSGLDPVSRKNLWDYLNMVRERDHTTIFLTTHYLDEAESADRVCIVNHGKIMFQATPTTLKKKLVDEKLTIDSDDRPALRKELRAKKLAFTEEKFITVPLGHKNPQVVIKSIETPLTLLRVESPSLEEAYIQIIGNGR